MSIHPMWFAAILSIAVFLPACSSTANGYKENYETMRSPSAASTAATSSIQVKGSAVEVKLSEFKIDMPASLPAGLTTFSVTNVGQIEHTIVIEGNGSVHQLDANLKPGETTTLQMNLSRGTYRVYCPISGHVQSGMDYQFTVN